MEVHLHSKTYTKESLKLLWEPDLCIHSGICFRGTPQVFDPRRKPWVILENELNDKIIKQVKQCPSGALKFV